MKKIDKVTPIAVILSLIIAYFLLPTEIGINVNVEGIRKQIIDGQLVVIRDGKAYNVAGVFNSIYSKKAQIEPTAATPYDPAGINGIEANVNNNNAIFNIAGQRLQKLQKGLNIVGGKKIIVK